MTIHFNPRLHKGGDSFLSRKMYGRHYFNPRLHKGGDYKRPVTRALLVDFNPRLHKGGDIAEIEKAEGITISIHASTKEATKIIVNFSF